MPELYNDKKLLYPDTVQISDEEFRVEQPFVYTFMKDGRRQNILVPAGFITDYGSIPKIFQNIIEPIGRYAACYIVHDLIYAAELFTRAECDWILLCHLQEKGAFWLRRNSVYSAVRGGGWFVWKKHDFNEVSKLRSLISQSKFEMSVFQNRWGINYDPVKDCFN